MATIQITVAAMRRNFPEFTSATQYPNGQIQFWLDFAYTMLNAGRWGQTLDMAAQLYAAHNVVLERRAIDEAGLGKPPGVTTGPVASKSVDKVSVAYSVSEGTATDASHWNLTIYGTRLWRLIKMFGMGPVYVGGTACGGGFFNAGWPWAGPPYWSGWYGST